MKLIKIFSVSLLGIFLYSCETTENVLKEKTYSTLYSERPLVLAVMPPINKTNNVEAKEFLYLTMSQPLCEKGYYVLPPFLCMEMFKTESAYDSEMFINGSVKKFGDVLGADAVLFTTITKWEKAAIAANIYVQIEYTLKSTKTDEILFNRVGDITYDASLYSNQGGLLGALINVAVSAINTAATAHVKVARSCNTFTLLDMPFGIYSLEYNKDQKLQAGKRVFSITIR